MEEKKRDPNSSFVTVALKPSRIIRADAFSNFDCQPVAGDKKTGCAPTLVGYF